MPHRSDGYFPRMASGAAAGLVGTLALKGLQAASGKLMPESLPSLKQDPGEYMVEHGAAALPRRMRGLVSEGAGKKAASSALALGYGMTFGLAYAAMRPRGGSLLKDGIVLGLATWAAGYLGWLPALGLNQPVWKQPAKKSIGPPLRHALYGIATVAVYDLAHELLARRMAYPVR